MPYENFDLAASVKSFNLALGDPMPLFAQVLPLEPSSWLRDTLNKFSQMVVAINTEKARSEYIIAPILGEIRDRSEGGIQIFSGVTFNLDFCKVTGSGLKYGQSSCFVYLNKAHGIILTIFVKSSKQFLDTP